ncbi:MAG: zf-TFIIB domain-containing protein [Methylobacter sp.]|nr:zf-TFIIB domain-containing protein [Methylococcales bacterium]MDD5113620.1 zf-TFIIB domain-containing protein [Methylobacter sp.]
MAKCTHCSAPLPANSNRCEYCRTRNDVDLTGRQAFSLVGQSSRNCPHCKTPLQTIELHLNGKVEIDRCNDCFGLFFDSGKIELLLEHAVSDVYDINIKQLDNINSERYQADKQVKYIKCPSCQNFMLRRVFGYRSGVIIDQCKIHGIWLDSGEITHLLEWKKAGGQLLAAQKEITENSKPAKSKSTGLARDNRTSGQSDFEGPTALDVLDTLANVLGSLFKE